MNNCSIFNVEKAVIGSVLSEPALMSTAIDLVKPEYFQAKTYAQLWEAMTNLFADGVQVDPMVLVESLGFKKVQSLGGEKVILDCFDSVPGIENFTHYAESLESKFKERELAKLLQTTQKELGDDDYDEVIARHQSGLVSLANANGKTGFVTAGELSNNWLNQFMEFKENPKLRESLYIQTGFQDYDHKYGGLPQGLTIVAGRPAMGKTAYALTLATNVVNQGKSVLFFSLEMSQEQLYTRLLSSLTGINSYFLSMGMVEDFQTEKVMAATAAIAEYDLHIDEKSVTLPAIRAQIEKWRLLNGRSPDLVIIDYLSLIQVPGFSGDSGRHIAIGKICNELAVYFTKELKSSLVLLSQLNRGVESRQDKRPVLSDLRDSGEIEQAANRVDMLYRDAYYNPETERPSCVEVNTVKNRSGTTGGIELMFDAPTTTFYDWNNGQ